MPNFGDFGSGHLVEFSSSQHPLLQAGGTYWLLPFPSGDTYARWNFNDQGRSSTIAESRNIQPVTWHLRVGLESAFEVTGTPSPVPEPGGLVLAGVGVVAYMAVRALGAKQLVGRQSSIDGWESRLQADKTGSSRDSSRSPTRQSKVDETLVG
jgi:hypothetical protein